MAKVSAKEKITQEKQIAHEPIIRELEPVKETKIKINVTASILALAIIISGTITGYVIAKTGGGGASMKSGGNATTSEGLKKIAGVEDTSTFKDSVEGILRDGGIDGEGSHHLERPGGISQNVYLTSSTVPLSDYVDKKVKVWGETFDAEKAGWLMDVGRLELLE